MIDVIYLSRGIDDGLNSAKKFLDSYIKCPAGCEHKLHFAVKGYEEVPEEYEQLKKIATDLDINFIDLPDDGFDFVAYGRAAQTLTNQFVFCINTHTEILFPNWLKMYEIHLNQNPKLKLLGAFGSWQNTPSINVNLRRAIPEENAEERRFYWNKYKDVVVESRKKRFNYPNYHVRSNAFTMDRELFLEYMQDKHPKYKFELYLYESGALNMTQYVLSKGYDVGIVGADGKFYPKEDWNVSNTFRSIDGDNALFADNQTRDFANFTNLQKYFKYRSTWSDTLIFREKEEMQIFSIYHKAPAFDEVRMSFYFTSNHYFPIQTGCAVNNELFILRDDVGENISDKNDLYGELTAHYWVWKNYIPENPDKKYVGFCHYRRLMDLKPQNLPETLSFRPNLFVSQLELSDLFVRQVIEKDYFDFVKDYDLCLSIPYNFYGANLKKQYLISKHPKIYLYLMQEIVLKFHPDYAKSMETVFNENKLHLSTMFIMKSELFSEFCAWIFPLFFQLEERMRTENMISEGNEEVLRIFAFLHERFFNVWLHKKKESQNLKIYESPIFVCKEWDERVSK